MAGKGGNAPNGKKETILKEHVFIAPFQATIGRGEQPTLLSSRQHYSQIT